MVLNVNAGGSHHRPVFTFVAPPGAAAEADPRFYARA
jgi:hypothetical protein